MLIRTDPFRELDRLTQQVFGANGTLARRRWLASSPFGVEAGGRDPLIDGR